MAASNLSNDNTIIITLHDDIIINHILSKLPPKSLIRFKSVSKLWNSTISNPNFKISPEHKSQAMILSSTMHKKLSNNVNNFSIPLRLFKETDVETTQPEIGTIIGSCNGLVLFYKGINIYLWNPCTSYCQKVLELEKLGNYNYYITVLPGFCYDPSSDDYVVLVSFRQYSPTTCSNLPLISATLKTKRWRPVTFPFDIDSIIPSLCIVNNTLHWLASPKGVWTLFDNPDIIIYFDAPSNGFNKFPTPDPKKEGGDNGDRGNLGGLGVLEGRLCLMRRNRFDVEVLVMKEYGVQESWACMFCIPNLTNNSTYEYAFLRMELLFSSFKMDLLIFKANRYYYAYYPSNHTWKQIKVQGQVIPYEESLVSPTGYHWNDEYDQKVASTVEI